MPEFDDDGGSLRPLEPAPKSQEEESVWEESGEEDDEYGNVRIVELRKCEEPLGIQLTHYSSPEDM